MGKYDIKTDMEKVMEEIMDEIDAKTKVKKTIAIPKIDKVAIAFGKDIVQKYRSDRVKPCIRNMIDYWVKNRNKDIPGLFISSDNGIGKTYASISIAKRIKVDFVYWTTSKLMQQLERINKATGIERLHMENEIKARIFILDDLNTDYNYGIPLRDLAEWFDESIRMGTTFIIMSNLTIEDIFDKSSENNEWRRIFVRIRNHCLCVSVDISHKTNDFICRDFEKNLEWRNR